MWTPSDLLQWQEQYLIDPACGAELMRQSRLYQLLSQLLDDPLLPPGSDMSEVRSVLDLACGPGDWALDLAWSDAELDVLGVDACPATIAHARMQARAMGLDNVSFEVMDLLSPWQVQEASFDCITGRFLNACLQPHAWPEVLMQCKRALRPGGIIRLTECLVGESSSRACEQLSLSYAYALWREGLRCTPAGRSLTSQQDMPLDALLKEAGFQAIQQQTLELDFSTGRPAHAELVEQVRIFFQLLKPFLLSRGGLSEAIYEQVFCRACMELLDDTFSGSWQFLTIWAQAPVGSSPEGTTASGSGRQMEADATSA